VSTMASTSKTLGDVTCVVNRGKGIDGGGYWVALGGEGDLAGKSTLLASTSEGEEGRKARL